MSNFSRDNNFTDLVYEVSDGYNFAKAYGIDSVAGAVIFALLYVPLLLMFIIKAITRPTYVYIVVAFFCAIRIVAFSLRALLASVTSAGQDLHLFVTYEIMYNVGFFGLLYSSYTLVLDRGRLYDSLPNGPISRITRKPFLFRLALVAAVAVGVTGSIESAIGTTASTTNTGNNLRKVSTYIFLSLCILVAFQTILLIRASSRTYKAFSGGFGANHGTFILCIISLLLLARESFFTATSNNTAKQNDENWWYLFAALTEFVAVVMFAAPGLVPAREEFSDPS